MGHHRDAHAHHAVDRCQGFRLCPFELYGSGGAFFQHPASSSHGLIEAALITQKRKITNHKRCLPSPKAAQSPADCAAMVKHLVQGDRQGGGVAQGGHGEGIANKHGIGARFAHHRS
jgi:hypothetical protein